jgi:hypothetical protein
MQACCLFISEVLTALIVLHASQMLLLRYGIDLGTYVVCSIPTFLGKDYCKFLVWYRSGLISM